MQYLSRSVRFIGPGVLFVVAVANTSNAAFTTSDYRDFVDPYLAKWEVGQNLPPSNPFTVGPVSITRDIDPTNVQGGFSFITGTPSDPAAPGGWGTWTGGGSVKLNLSAPVSAFGVTFSRPGNSFGSILSAYDGPNGTGQLIGQIESVVIPAPWSASNQPIDFVGVVDNHPSIRSVVLSGHGTELLFVHALAVSIPEPSTIPLAIIACATLLTRRRKSVLHNRV
jgi:hypothetical protein